MHKCTRFFNIVAAFQHFAGKSMKVTDFAERLHESDLSAMERSLQVVSASCRNLNKEEWPDLHTLADQIDRALAQRF